MHDYRPFDLGGKMALITGGNSGIGLGMAEGLAAAGPPSASGAPTRARTRPPSSGSPTTAPAQAPYVTWPTRPRSTTRSPRPSLPWAGDACFVNAGAAGRREVRSFVEMTAAEWRRVLSVNLDGAFFTLRVTGYGANAIVHASAYHTGDTFVIDGGYNAL